MKSHDYYQEKIKAYQHQLTAEFERARRQSIDMQDATRREFERKLGELQAMRDDANRRARALVEVGQRSNDDLNQALSEAYGQVLDATRKAVQRFTDLTRERDSGHVD